MRLSRCLPFLHHDGDLLVRPVVHHQQLPLLKLLGQNALDRFADKLRAIVRQHQNADTGWHDPIMHGALLAGWPERSRDPGAT